MKKVLLGLLPVIVLCLVMVRNTPLFGVIGLPVAVLWLVNVLFMCMSRRESRMAKELRSGGAGPVGVVTLNPLTFHGSPSTDAD